jgi:hypothetical protein
VVKKLEEIGGKGDERDVTSANLIKDMKHGLRIRLRHLKALQKGLDGRQQDLIQSKKGVDGAIISLGRL